MIVFYFLNFSLTVFFYIKFRVKMFIQVDDFFDVPILPPKKVISASYVNGFTAQDWNNNLWKRILEENSTVVVEGPEILGATTDMLSISAWLWRIWSRIRLIPVLRVPHFLSPWKNDPHKIDSPGQTVPKNLVPLDKWSPTNLGPAFTDHHNLSP